MLIYSQAFLCIGEG